MRTVPRALAALAILTLAAASSHAELLAGAGRRSIVPDFPMHMGGFGARLETFEGVHDEVYARALYLGDGETELIVIASGLMNFDEELTALIRKTVARETGVLGENILVSCVHNHSAPSYYQLPGEEQERPRDFMAARFSEAAVEAYRSRVPAELGYAAGEIAGATRNRQQDNETAIDTQVGVLRVEEKEGRKIIAILCNFTGHPVIVGSSNLLLSGEYPGAASRTIEKVLGGVALFTQGACGDVTVHRSGDPFLEVERLGRLVAGEVIKTAESIRPSDAVRLASVYEEVPLRLKELPSVADATAQLAEARAALEAARSSESSRAIIRQLDNRADLLSALLRQASGVADGSLQRPDGYTGSVHVIQIGDLVIVGIPGELFVEYALEMRQRIAQSTGKGAILVGYANGNLGYIVTPRAMETGGYEASVARVHSTSGRALTERAMALVNQNVK